MDQNRKTAFDTLMDIETKEAYSNLALNSNIKNNRPSNPSFVRNLVYGVLENKILLDYIINGFLKKDIKSLGAKEKTILRMGIYQLGYMNSVPEYAGVNESVKLAKKYCKGRDGFINGVLRNYARNKDKIKMPEVENDETKYFSIKYSCEPWIIKLWEKQYGKDTTKAILEATYGNQGLTIRANPLKTKVETLIERLQEKNIRCDKINNLENGIKISNAEDIIEDELYEKGLFSVQDGSSIKTVEILSPKPKEFVIDVCAAPGGKTLAIAEMMENTGEIIALDIYENKLNIVNKQSKRLGVSNIETKVWDSTKTNAEWIGKADRVLADVVCSGLGVIGKKPEIKYKKKTKEFEKLPEKQLSILKASSEYVKSGGILQYSTCTINRYENQDVVEKFIKDNKNFEVVEEKEFLPHIDGTDGFYVCKMIKK